MDRPNKQFGSLVQSLLKGHSLRQVSEASGISHTTIAAWQKGGLPRCDKLEQFCTRLQATPEERAALFRLAGLPDPLLVRGTQHTKPSKLIYAALTELTDLRDLERATPSADRGRQLSICITELEGILYRMERHGL